MPVGTVRHTETGLRTAAGDQVAVAGRAGSAPGRRTSTPEDVDTPSGLPRLQSAEQVLVRLPGGDRAARAPCGPGAVASRLIVAVFSTGGAAGAASSWTWVTAYSPMPLSVAASTGNGLARRNRVRRTALP